ncbi:MAG TPA: lipid II flippase MurJ [Pyrinomonadaceae bacterium]|jgi:peptidoglycan biosynthesis protein MviN/MurJ (putative lipid II flippase)
MKQSLILAWLSASNIVLGLFIQWYVITTLGVGIETDALFAGMVLPQLILALFSTSLTYVLVPILATEDEESFRRDAWAFFLLVTGCATALSLLLYLTAGWWVPLLVPGFSAAGRALAVQLTRIQLASLIFTAATSVLWSVYGARQKFIWTEASALVANFSGLLLLVWSLPLYGIRAAAWAMVLRTGLQLICLMPGLGRWRAVEWKSRALGEAWRRVKPILLGTIYFKTDPLFDRILASMAPAGGLSLLYIGQQIYGAATQIINRAVAAPMVPLLAIQAKAGDWQTFKRTYRQRLAAISALTLMAYTALLLLGRPSLRVLIGHGGITEDNVSLLWWIMVALWGVFMGGALGQVTSLAFYALGDTRTPTRLGVWTYTIYIPAKILVFIYYGLTGMAVSISVFVALNFILQFVLLEHSLSVDKTSRHECA